MSNTELKTISSHPEKPVSVTLNSFVLIGITHFYILGVSPKPKHFICKFVRGDESVLSDYGIQGVGKNKYAHDQEVHIPERIIVEALMNSLIA